MSQSHALGSNCGLSKTVKISMGSYSLKRMQDRFESPTLLVDE